MPSSSRRAPRSLDGPRWAIGATGARSLLRHPRTAMAIRASVAAVVAWLVAQRLPGVAEFAFYAPFGAVVTTYSAVVRSTTETVRAVAAIMLGAVVGLAAHLLVPWTVVAVAAAVGVGVLLGALPWLGDHRTYVPVAAIFLLLIGDGQEIDYAASYAGLFGLGAVVTIALNAVFPTVPLPQAQSALRTLRGEVGEHLRHMAGVLGGDDVGAAPPRDRLTARLNRARDAVDDLVEAAAGNRRARRERPAIDRTRADFAALERVVLLVDDLHDLSDDAPWGTRISGVSSALLLPMAAALAALAEAVTTAGLADTEPGHRAAADAALGDLAAALLEHERRAGADAQGLVVATVVTTLRRTLSALTPAERIGLSVSPWPEGTADG